MYRLEGELLDNLRLLLDEVPGLSVVVTSSWREVFSLEQLRSQFPKEIRARIEGVTPLSKVPSEHQRYKEILAYLKHHGKTDVTWIAIDDDPDYFPSSAPVVIVDPSEGLSMAVVEMIRRSVPLS